MMILTNNSIKDILITAMSIFVLLTVLGSHKVKGQELDKMSASVITNTAQVNEYINSKKALPLKQILTILEEHYDVTFLYKGGLVNNKMVKNPDIQIGEKTGEQLSIIIDNLGLKLHRVNKTSYIVLPKPFDGKFKQQMQVVSGTVTDASTGESLPGVNVVLKGTTTGTSTNSEGQYELEVPSLQDTLMFSFIGYQTQEVPINSRTQIDVELQSQAVTGEDVVVIGYGTQKRRDVTGSVASVQSEQLEEMPNTSFDNALQGRMSGVTVTEGTGAPGGRTRVRIRGQNSVLGGSDPLYVLDGVPILRGAEGNTDVLATINPDDIASIDVLKDASATAIYGSRGANGVVLITTKQGTRGEPRISFEQSFGLSRVRNILDLMNTEQFVEIANERAMNDGASTLPFPNGVNDVPDVNTDWLEEATRTAMRQNYSLSFSGGDEDTRYLVSSSYLNEEGTITGSEFMRGSIRVNLEQDVTDRLKVTPTLMVSRTEADRVASEAGPGGSGDAQGVILNTFMAPPFFKPRDEDGNFTPASTLKQFGFSPGSGENPIAVAEGLLNQLTTKRLLGNVTAEYDITDALSVKTLVGIDNTENEIDNFTPRFLQAGEPGGEASETRSNTVTYLYEQTVQYDQDFGENHSIDALGGFTWQKEETEFLQGDSENFVTDDISNNNLAAGINFSIPTSGTDGFRVVSWVSRINYAFKDRYLFTFTGRIDGSSVFGGNDQYGFFPSGAIAWRVSEEDFMQDINLISDLKLRVSLGLSGNLAIDPFQSLQQFNPQELVLGESSTVGFAPTNLPNPDLQFEETEQFDIGAEIGLWNQRVTVSGDYFQKETTDLLAQVNLPQSSGFTSILRNIGTMVNKGYEIQVGADVIRRDQFQFNIDANMTSQQNLVKQLARDADIIGPDVNIIGPANIIRPGHAISSFFGLETDGLTEDGLFNFVDQNGDGEITTDDRVILGSPFADFEFGVNLSFSYKNFFLTSLIQGEIGKQLWNANKERGAISMNRGFNQLKDVVNRWRPDDPDQNAPFPRATGNLNVAPSDFFVEDASFVRINNVRLSYTVPSSALSNLNFLNRATFYVSGQNLATFTNYSWFSPQTNSFPSDDLRIGVDRNPFPTSRTFTLGAQVDF